MYKCKRMTSLKAILKYFRVAKIRDNTYPTAEEHNDSSKREYLFFCKRCGSQSEPMNITQNIKSRLSLHLTRYCHPSTSADSELEQQQERSSR